MLELTQGYSSYYNPQGIQIISPTKLSNIMPDKFQILDIVIKYYTWQDKFKILGTIIYPQHEN